MRGIVDSLRLVLWHCTILAHNIPRMLGSKGLALFSSAVSSAQVTIVKLDISFIAYLGSYY